MFSFILCSCLVLAGSSQLYTSSIGNYGYPSAYGNTMGSSYMGAYSPYSSPFGMSGYPGSVGSFYGQNMYGSGVGVGMSGYGMPYSRLGSTMPYVGRYYSPFDPFSVVAKKAKKA